MEAQRVSCLFFAYGAVPLLRNLGISHDMAEAEAIAR
jgi:hypothetical protein